MAMTKCWILYWQSCKLVELDVLSETDKAVYVPDCVDSGYRSRMFKQGGNSSLYGSYEFFDNYPQALEARLLHLRTQVFKLQHRLDAFLLEEQLTLNKLADYLDPQQQGH